MASHLGYVLCILSDFFNGEYEGTWMHLICKLSKISRAVRAIWLCFWCYGEVGLVLLPLCLTVWTLAGRRWDGVVRSGMIECSFIKKKTKKQCLFFLLCTIPAVHKQHRHLCLPVCARVWVKLTQVVVFFYIYLPSFPCVFLWEADIDASLCCCCSLFVHVFVAAICAESTWP